VDATENAPTIIHFTISQANIAKMVRDFTETTIRQSINVLGQGNVGGNVQSYANDPRARKLVVNFEGGVKAIFSYED
jgi:hypothetical protein